MQRVNLITLKKMLKAFGTTNLTETLKYIIVDEWLDSDLIQQELENFGIYKL